MACGLGAGGLEGAADLCRRPGAAIRERLDLDPADRLEQGLLRRARTDGRRRRAAPDRRLRGADGAVGGDLAGGGLAAQAAAAALARKADGASARPLGRRAGLLGLAARIRRPPRRQPRSARGRGLPAVRQPPAAGDAGADREHRGAGVLCGVAVVAVGIRAVLHPRGRGGGNPALYGLGGLPLRRDLVAGDASAGASAEGADLRTGKARGRFPPCADPAARGCGRHRPGRGRAGGAAAARPAVRRDPAELAPADPGRADAGPVLAALFPDGAAHSNLSGAAGLFRRGSDARRADATGRGVFQRHHDAELVHLLLSRTGGIRRGLGTAGRVVRSSRRPRTPPRGAAGGGTRPRARRASAAGGGGAFHPRRAGADPGSRYRCRPGRGAVADRRLRPGQKHAAVGAGGSVALWPGADRPAGGPHRLSAAGPPPLPRGAVRGGKLSRAGRNLRRDGGRAGAGGCGAGPSCGGHRPRRAVGGRASAAGTDPRAADPARLAGHGRGDERAGCRGGKGSVTADPGPSAEGGGDLRRPSSADRARPV